MTDHDERDDYDDERRDRPLAADHIVHWPASTMWAFGLLQLIFTQTIIGFLIVLTVVVNFVDGDETLADFWSHVTSNPELWLIPLGWLVATAWTAFVIWAANGMRRYRRYWFAVTAAVLTMFSVPFFYLAVIQLPIGLWVLIVLARRDVRARFEAVARGTITGGSPT